MSNNCCQIEAIVSFDERGQLVLPKDVRKKFNLKAGDKFALISCVEGSDASECCAPGENVGLCCFTLVQTNHLQGMVEKALGPMMSEIFATQK